MDVAVRLERHAPRSVAARDATAALAILRGHLEAPVWEGAMEWPLVGRETSLRRLTAILDRPPGSSVTIAGDAGVGKTRLASEFATTAASRGRKVDRVWASPSAAPIPFGAVAHLLTLPPNSAELGVLLGGLLAELNRRGGDKPPVLVVDDAHHLDEHTASLLYQAAVHHVATVVLTVRDGDAVPAALTLLWKDGAAERIDVAPLSQQATEQLVEAALEGHVDPLTLSELWQRSAGNPLFLRELILGGLDSGALERDGDLWRAKRPLAPSTRLAELVRARLGKLNSHERRVVDALAVADTLELQVLEQIAGTHSLESLEERHVIELEQSGNRSSVRLAHPIYAEIMATDMPRTRARRIMRTLADGLEREGTRRPDDLLRLALWRLGGGGGGDSALMVAASRKALAAFDAPLAERFARAALAHNDEDAPALLALGEALTGQQRVADADDALRRAEQRADGDDDVAQVALARANLLYFRAGRIDEAAQLLTEALGRLSDPGWRDEIESLLVLFRSAAGQLRAVAAAGRRLLEREARPRAVVHALTYSSIANVMLGRFSEAEEQVGIGLRMSAEAADELPLSGEMLRINGVMANAYAGRLRRAMELGLDGHRRALDARVPEVSAMWAMNLAECHILTGDIRTALRTMLGCLAIVRDRDPFSVYGIAAGFSSVCASWLSRHEQARDLRQEVLDLDLARDVRSRIWLDRATVWTTTTGEGAEAAALLAMEAGGRAVRDTHLVWGAWLFHDAARLGLARPAAERLAALSRRVEGDLVPAMALHARALADADALALERAASAFDQLGSRLFAAEASAQAQQQYLRDGRLRLARVAAARTALLAAHCPGVRTPALADLAPVPLTRRELEIARLAASGLSSRELSERLIISVRTVDNHLGTIYSKLGITSRTELPAVLGAVGVSDEAGAPVV